MCFYARLPVTYHFSNLCISGGFLRSLMESGRSGIVKIELFMHAGGTSSNFLILLMTYSLPRCGLMARYPNLLLFSLFLFPLVFLLFLFLLFSLIIHYIWFGRENCIRNTAIKLTNQVCYSSYSFSILFLLCHLFYASFCCAHCLR